MKFHKLSQWVINIDGIHLEFKVDDNQVFRDSDRGVNHDSTLANMYMEGIKYESLKTFFDTNTSITI